MIGALVTQLSSCGVSFKLAAALSLAATLAILFLARFKPVPRRAAIEPTGIVLETIGDIVKDTVKDTVTE